MEPVKVVLRYIEGRVLKGFTQNFFPGKDRFHLFSIEKPSGPPTEVFLKDLKAVFVVKTFRGKPGHEEQKNFKEAEKTFGRKVEVVFRDGEIMVGSTLSYDLKKKGFFIFPADSHSNNLKIFLVSSAVKYVRQV